MVEVDFLVALAREAGTMARTDFGAAVVRQKPGGSLVTDTDVRVQEHLVRRLRDHEPDPSRLFLVAEEANGEPLNPGVASPPRGACVVAIDPIDGTTSFASGLPLWGVSLGVLCDGAPKAGVLYVPMLGGPDGWLYRTEPDGRATRNGTTLSVVTFRGWTRRTQVAVPSGIFRAGGIGSFEGKIRSLGSAAHHVALVAAGAVTACIGSRSHIWDVAGAGAILLAAGGGLWDLEGNPLDWQPLLTPPHPRTPRFVAGPYDAAQALIGILDDSDSGGRG